eukprot:6491537-Amphidinium_carterae.3
MLDAEREAHRDGSVCGEEETGEVERHNPDGRGEVNLLPEVNPDVRAEVHPVAVNPDPCKEVSADVRGAGTAEEERDGGDWARDGDPSWGEWWQNQSWSGWSQSWDWWRRDPADGREAMEDQGRHEEGEEGAARSTDRKSAIDKSPGERSEEAQASDRTSAVDTSPGERSDEVQDAPQRQPIAPRALFTRAKSELQDN